MSEACPADVPAVLAVVTAVESAYAGLDLDAVAARGATLETVVACVDGPFGPRNAARVHGARALVAWAAGDAAATDAALWGAFAASPEFVLDPKLAPPGTPLALRAEAARDHAARSRIVLAPDVTLDGDPTPPSVDADRFVLAQRPAGDAWATRWELGRDLPADWRLAPPEPVEPEPFPVARLAIGAGLTVVGVTTFGAGVHRAVKFNRNELAYDDGAGAVITAPAAEVLGLTLAATGGVVLVTAF